MESEDDVLAEGQDDGELRLLHSNAGKERTQKSYDSRLTLLRNLKWDGAVNYKFCVSL